MAWRLSIGPWLSLAILFGVSQWTLAQTADQFRLEVEIKGDEEHRLKSFEKRTYRLNELEIVKQGLLTEAYRFGYLATQIAIDTMSESIKLLVNVGSKYQWSSLKMSESTKAELRKAGTDVDRWQNKPISPAAIAGLAESVLVNLENRGHPFAKFYLDSLSVDSSELSSSLIIERGPAVKFDSLEIIGNLRVNEHFIANYLNIKEGSDYSEKAFLSISEKLNDLTFLTETRPPEIRFNKSHTKMVLFLASKRASRFDGIIGVLPDNLTGKLLFTGDVSLELENALRQGESIQFNWRKLQRNTQDLTANLVLPFAFGTFVSPDFNLKLYRRDTLFSDVFAQVGLRYFINRKNYVRIFADRQVSNLISTKGYEGLTTPPPFLDRSIVSYGLGLNYSRWDLALNPSKGFESFAEIAAGNKVIRKNSALPSAIYDSLNLVSFQLKARMNIAYCLPIVKRLIWHQRLLASTLLNNQIFNNEAARIGGFKTMRGFNEESIYATSYAILRSELRYQLDRMSYAFLFYDQSRYENKSLNYLGARRDSPFAFGAGFTFSTKAGLFNLSYALGSELGNPVQIRSAKVHFGFVSIF